MALNAIPRYLTRTLLSTILFAAFSWVLAGCGSGAGSIATIGDYRLTRAEFERQYLRNNGGLDSARKATDQTKHDFLDLLVKYRLKVLEARDKGYDRDSAIQSELKEYRNSLAVPYMTERALIDPKVEVLYKRRQEELRVAHILFRVTPDSTGKTDTMAVLTEANRVLALAKAGERFDSLAAKYSQDPGTAKHGGDLMYFTAGMTAPSFDEAIYTLQPGQISPAPVRTAFGYHLVKMLERQPAKGEIEVSHILIRMPQDKPEDSTAALAKANAIMDSLRNGGDFKVLATRNSEDPQSGANGGDLGWVPRRRFVPEFELVAFSMKVGETRGPVRTQFGYHIIKVTGQRTGKPFEEQKQELKDLYRRYGYEEDNKKFIAAIEARHGVTVKPEVVEAVAASVDTVATTSVQGWSDKIPADVRMKALAVVSNKPLTVDQMVATVTKDRDLQSRPLNRASLRELAAELGRREAMAEETADLESRFPEFAELMQEYKEGVLLFRTEQEAVWNKVVVKDDELHAFWEKHQSEFRFPPRAQFREIFVNSDSLARALKDSVDKGVDFAALASRHTQRAGYQEKGGDWGLQEEKTNELAKKALLMQRGWVEGPIRFQYGWSIIKCEDRQPAREKTFEEAKSEVSSKYQEVESKRLEREWIDSLRARYGVKVDEAELAKALSQYKEGV